MRFRLLEGKNKEQTFNQYKQKLIENDPFEYGDETDAMARSTFDSLMLLDPTYNENSTTTGDFGIWILNQFIKDNLSIDGSMKEPPYAQINDVLQDFVQKKSNLKNKDINSYKTPRQLFDALSQIELTDRQKERKIRKDIKGAKKVASTDNFDIYVPETYAASCALGKGSGWCTADSRTDRYYNYYKDEFGGDYYILISKDGKWKYQLHFPSDQYSAAGTNPDINTPNEEEMIELSDIIEKWPELETTLFDLQAESKPEFILANFLAEKLNFDRELSIRLPFNLLSQTVKLHADVALWFMTDVDEVSWKPLLSALSDSENAFSQWTKASARYNKNSVLTSDDLIECTEAAFKFKLFKRIMQLKNHVNHQYLQNTNLQFSLFGSDGFLYKLKLTELAEDILNSQQGDYFVNLMEQRNWDQLEDTLEMVFPHDDEDTFRKNIIRFTKYRIIDSLTYLPSLYKAYFNYDEIIMFFIENFEDELIDTVEAKTSSNKLTMEEE